MPLFGGRRSMLEVQNQALIKTARERAERIDELERELQSAASQIGQLQRELQALERTSKVERDLQQARNEVERLTLERDFYSKKASALEQENRELTDSATKYSVHAQKSERPRRLPNTLNEPRSWNEVLPMGSKAGTRTQ